MRILHTGLASRPAFSFRSQPGIVSGPCAFVGTILDNFFKIYDSVVVIMDGNWLLVADRFRAWEWSDVRGWKAFMGARKV